eukprot:3341241-Rhodomonas_salina.2
MMLPGKVMASFTYLRLNDHLMDDGQNWIEFASALFASFWPVLLASQLLLRALFCPSEVPETRGASLFVAEMKSGRRFEFWTGAPPSRPTPAPVLTLPICYAACGTHVCDTPRGTVMAYLLHSICVSATAHAVLREAVWYSTSGEQAAEATARARSHRLG